MKNLFQKIILGVLVLSLSSCGYNKIVELEEDVNAKWGQVESVYQRRADLIPQLIGQAKTIGSITDKYAAQLSDAQEKTIVNLSSEDLANPSKLESYEASQAEIGKLMSDFMNDLQNQPDFQLYKDNILDLKAQIEGTENRINNARRKYNMSVQEYNAYINKVPQNFTSGILGFDEKSSFEAKAGAK